MALGNGANTTIWNGSFWTRSQRIKASDSVESISCATPSFCGAAGLNFNAPGNVGGTVYTWRGSWSTHVIPGETLYGPISCPRPNFCMALATTEPGYVTWNGAAWSAPSTSTGGLFAASAVSCASESFCMAVGGSVSSAWNGKIWEHRIRLPGPAALADTGIGSVSCTSLRLCVAVSSAGYAFQWNGTTWTHPVGIDVGNAKQYASNPNNGVFELSTSCIGPGFCMVLDASGHAVAWGGGHWLAPTKIDQPLPLSVSCSSAAHCVAVDERGRALEYAAPSPPVTIVPGLHLVKVGLSGIAVVPLILSSNAVRTDCLSVLLSPTARLSGHVTNSAGSRKPACGNATISGAITPVKGPNSYFLDISAPPSATETSVKVTIHDRYGGSASFDLAVTHIRAIRNVVTMSSVSVTNSAACPTVLPTTSCFSIQQDFFVTDPQLHQEYWIQNAVGAVASSPTSLQLVGACEVWSDDGATNLKEGGCVGIKPITTSTPLSLPGSITLDARLVVSGGVPKVSLTASIGGSDFAKWSNLPLPRLSSGAFISDSPTLGGTPYKRPQVGPSELGVVGMEASQTATFSTTTSGMISSYAETGGASSWVPASVATGYALETGESGKGMLWKSTSLDTVSISDSTTMVNNDGLHFVLESNFLST